MHPTSVHRVAVRPLASDPVRAFDRIEFDVVARRSYDDPFDPNEIRVDAAITLAGQTFIVPAFWHEPPDGDPCFRIRFAPPLSGEASMIVTARDRDGAATSDAIRFTVAPSDCKGFVRRAANDRYFRLDSGEGLFLNGPNLAWPDAQGITTYERWFATLAANGGNFARIWLCHPNRPTESDALGPGRYDLAAYAYYDAVLDAAQRHGIYLMLCFMNHRDMLVRDMWGDAQWPRSPYNAANGGPCATPQEFTASPTARELFKRRLRYSIARFGAFTSVAFWEFWNEQDFAGIDVPAEWTLEMAQFIRATDPHARGITNSFGMGHQRAVWESPLIDMTTHHAYPGDAVPDSTHAVVAFHREHERFHKPSWMGEIGIDHRFGDERVDPRGIGTNMHNVHWASLAAGGCGTAAMWWWDGYVDAKNLWPVFRGIGAFARTIDWANRRFVPIILAPPRADAASTGQWDVVLPVIGRSNRTANDVPIRIDEAGRAGRGLPGTLHVGAGSSLRLVLDGPTPTAIRVGVHAVEGTTRLNLLVDGRVSESFALTSDTLPHTYEVTLTPGVREIGLTSDGTGNVTLSNVTLCNAVPSRWPPLDAFTLRCDESGECIVWLKDRSSHWRADLDGETPQTFEGVAIDVPLARSTAAVRWFDTRSGAMVRDDAVRSSGGIATLIVPPFTRDIVLHLVPTRSGRA